MMSSLEHASMSVFKLSCRRLVIGTRTAESTRQAVAKRRRVVGGEMEQAPVCIGGWRVWLLFRFKARGSGSTVKLNDRYRTSIPGSGARRAGKGETRAQAGQLN